MITQFLEEHQAQTLDNSDCVVSWLFGRKPEEQPRQEDILKAWSAKLN